MRTLSLVLLLMFTGTAAAKNKAATEAEQDGFNGSVHTVTITNQEIVSKLDPATAWVLPRVPTENLEYDLQGYRTKTGTSDRASGVFLGQVSQFVRDENGLVIERTTTQLPSQDVVEHDVYGPFGLVEATEFSFGKPASVHTVSYDPQGNVLEDIRTDGEGNQNFRTLFRRNPEGAWTERTTWLRGRLHSHETYEPETDFQRYEEYDQSGDVTTTFTHRYNRIESYWSRSNDRSGLSMLNQLDNGDSKSWSCHNRERACDGKTLHSVYLDSARHNPLMTEVLTDDGKLVARAYLEYQLDEHKNWISRKVWVESGEQGQRVLYQTDSRTITYWPDSISRP